MAVPKSSLSEIAEAGTRDSPAQLLRLAHATCWLLLKYQQKKNRSRFFLFWNMLLGESFLTTSSESGRSTKSKPEVDTKFYLGKYGFCDKCWVNAFGLRCTTLHNLQSTEFLNPLQTEVLNLAPRSCLLQFVGRRLLWWQNACSYLVRRGSRCLRFFCDHAYR